MAEDLGEEDSAAAGWEAVAAREVGWAEEDWVAGEGSDWVEAAGLVAAGLVAVD